MLDEETGLYYAGKAIIDLTPLETATLSYLIKHKGTTVLHKDITREILGKEYDKSPANFTQIIHRLNRKLKYELAIQTRISIGYKLVYIGKRVL